MMRRKQVRLQATSSPAEASAHKAGPADVLESASEGEGGRPGAEGVVTRDLLQSANAS